MASLAAGIVDPTKAGKYPVVLSDALLGKDPKEVYTGVRYNHKPSLSSSTAPHQARIKPAASSTSGKKRASANTYDLSFQDDGGRYAYQGTRGNEDKQYILIFDPERQVFVLHKVDSTFNMNLVQTPTTKDAESLRQEYPQLDKLDETKVSVKARPASAKSGASKATTKPSASKARKPAPPKDTSKKSGDIAVPDKKAAASSKPGAAPSNQAEINKKKRRTASYDEEDDDSSDDDGLLTIEDPGGAAASASRDFSPGFMDQRPVLRAFSDFARQNEEGRGDEEDDDADAESDDDDAFEHFTLPSPINRQMQQTGNGTSNRGDAQPMQVDRNDEDEDEEDEEMEDVNQRPPTDHGIAAADDGMALDEEDLEAALMAELGEGSADKEESDISEEE